MIRTCTNDPPRTPRYPTRGRFAGDYLNLRVHRWASRESATKPVIAQIHGYALAGGLELAMACDLVVAAEGTKLGEPEIWYGSAPVALLMPYLIGQKKTRELLLTGDLIDAAEAERLAAEGDALADRLARTPPEVMAPTKLMLNRAMDAAGFRLAVEAGIDLGAIINAADTPEQREWDTIVRRDGLRAALEWRDRRYDQGLDKGF